MRTVDWYIDFISPFAFLQAEMLARAPLAATLRCKPVLFAGLLEHWGQLGPAEIAPKRRFTFRYCLWRARQLGIPMRMPPAHPFNPLPLLRLAIALDGDFTACLAIGRFVFQDGKSADDPKAWRALADELGVRDADQQIGRPEVKATLRSNGEEAVAHGVFGVPTLVYDDELFWGADAIDMCRDWLAGDALFGSAEMKRVDDLPVAAQRPR